jgi:hypothetical protein
MTKEEARQLYRELSKVVDKALKETNRDPADPPTDGNIAVMTIFNVLEDSGFELVKKR